jgi:two-component system phosphate regulon sensor histidine kinase PhoR
MPPLFGKKTSLQEALEIVRRHLRTGQLPQDIVEELLKRKPTPGPPGLQELLEGIPLPAAVLEGGGKIAARNQAAQSMLGNASTVAEVNVALNETAARALAGWPHRRELPLGDAQVEAHVTPLSNARALLVLRDLSAERRSDKVRRDFIANASHELRTPVTAIRGASETLLDSVPLEGAARDFVQMIARHALRLNQLTEDLLDLYRLETGALQLERESVQLQPLAQSSLEVIAQRAKEKRLTLQLEVPERLRASADHKALEQILTNLLDNAVKYTPEGGRITVSGEGKGPRVVLSVSDTGTGIDAKHLKRIFERFYRADEGRSRALGGTGLGLAIVKHLSQAMGGEAGVESGPRGSRFWVELESA